MASPADAPPSSAPGPDAVKARIVAHMNKDHAGELTLYLRAFNGLSASAAAARPQLVGMTLAAMTVQTAATGSTPHVVAIEPPLAHLGEARGRLVEMAAEARRRLGLSEIRVDRFARPAGFDCVVFFGVAFYFFAFATRGLVRPGTGAWALLDAVFPYRGAAGYLWLVGAIFVPVLAIHVTECWWMATSRLAKHQVPVGSRVWWLWVGSVFFEGFTAFQRFDGLVAAERKRREGLKH